MIIFKKKKNCTQTNEDRMMRITPLEADFQILSEKNLEK